jgi:outer membrane lipoprotein-sorting protein
MKKTMAIGSLFLLFLTLGPAAAQSLSVSDILEKVVEANGGRKALEAITDTTITGGMEMIPMAINGSVTIYHKEPGMTRQDMSFMGMTMTQAFDGETAWFTNPQTQAAQEAPAEMQDYSKRGALEMGNSLLLDPESFGVTHNLKGKETIEGSDYYVLERVYPDGTTTALFIDSQKYFVHKQIQKSLNMVGSEVEQEIIYSDYKDVEGIPFPFTMTIMQEGEVFGIITIADVKFNSGLEDALFKMEK